MSPLQENANTSGGVTGTMLTSGLWAKVFDDSETDIDVYVRLFDVSDPSFTGYDTLAMPFPIRVTTTGPNDTITEVVISGLPAGSVLSAGVPNGDGSVWTFAGAPPANLTLTAPDGYAGVFTASVSATTSGAGATTTASATQDVTIADSGIAPNVTLTVSAPEIENSPITRAFTSLDAWAGSVASPVQSPDGAKIAFVGSFDETVFDVYIQDVASGDITLVSAAVGGGSAGGFSGYPVFSPTSDRILFVSDSATLVANDTNGQPDLFIYEAASGAITRVSLTSAGEELVGGAINKGVFSPDGTKILFTTYATNAADGGTNGLGQLVVKNLTDNSLTLVSSSELGEQGNDYTPEGVFSPDGLSVAFASYASNLVADDTNGAADIFIKNLADGTIWLASTTEAIELSAFSSSDPVFSPDGTKIAYQQYGEYNDSVFAQLVVKDLITGAPQIVSTSSDGQIGDNQSQGGAVFSPDSTKIAFFSYATNLAPGHASSSVATVYVKDLTTNITTRVSVAQYVANGDSYPLSFSADGTKLYLTNYATNLLDGAGPGDVLIADLALLPSAAPDHRTVQVDLAFDALGAEGGEARVDWNGDGIVDDVLAIGAAQTSLTLSNRFAGGGSFDATIIVESPTGLQDVSQVHVLAASPTQADLHLVVRDSLGNDLADNVTAYAFSDDGTKLVFSSRAIDVVAGQSSSADIFVKDMNTGVVTALSQTTNGEVRDISADGTKIVFSSNATSIVSGDTNSRPDLFVRDLTTGSTTRITTNSSGVQATGAANQTAIGPAAFSGDGTKVVFVSGFTNLVTGDTNGLRDVFVKNLLTGVTERVNVSASGVQANANAFNVAFSLDGSTVYFDTDADTLVAGDTNGAIDLFAKNLVTGAITRLNTNAAGVESQGGIGSFALSGDGTHLVFSSDATDLVDGDTNGGTDVFVKNLATGEISIASTNVGFDSSYLAINYDGTKVAYTGVGKVFVKDLVTGDIIQISVEMPGSEAQNITFSADGAGIYFTNYADLIPADDNGNSDLYYAGFGGPLVGDGRDEILLGSNYSDALDGGAGADWLRGGGGADTLIGGAGVDRLEGGGGADSFVYMTPPVDADQILDFRSGEDRIAISASGFPGLVEGNSPLLVTGLAPTASGTDGQFLYDTSDGRLWWDVDGEGAGAAVLLATLTNRPLLTESDFSILG